MIFKDQLRCLILCGLAILANSFVIRSPSKWTNNEEIKIFQEYLRIPTVHPDIDYGPAVAFLEKQAASLDLPFSVYYPVDDQNPVVVITWEGSQPELPSIMLNSHMDVVPVYEEYWTHPPFAAEIDENGDIYARGTQDIKSVGIQYLAAVRALKRKGVSRLKRTIHIVFVPDEETGGGRGMAGFVQTNDFKNMNVSFILDEGGTQDEDDGMWDCPAYYIEKIIWQIELTFHGQSGHGSRLFDDTPGEKLNYVVGKLSKYREQEKKLSKQKGFPYGNVTSINLTILKGGVANNVIPAEMTAVFDIRVAINADINKLERKIKRWCREAGGNITMKNLERGPKQIPTVVDDTNPFWMALKNGAKEAGLNVKPKVMAGASDMRHVRNLKIPAIGFAPMKNTISRMHDHNKYINADVFLDGIEAYTKIISNLGSL